MTTLTQSKLPVAVALEVPRPLSTESAIMPIKPQLRAVSSIPHPERLNQSVRRKISTSPSSSSSASTSDGKVSKYTRLTSRSLIQLRGSDVEPFLQGLIPAKFADSQGNLSISPIYTTFLNAQGRILNDVFIYPPGRRKEAADEGWLIEVDSAHLIPLMNHLRKHKLRSKFKLEKVPQDDLGVFYAWPGQQSREISLNHEIIGGNDVRPGMGSRWVLPPNEASDIFAQKGISSETSLEDYTVHRMLQGFAEGQSEIVASSALPQETNIDMFDGIDFHKGCYLGQELTIRTHHTGVVRKRILPCQIYAGEPPPPEQSTPEYDSASNLKLPPPGSNIAKTSSLSRGRSTGRWLGGIGNIGLALCRLEAMTDISLTAEGGAFHHPGDQFKISWDDADSNESGTIKVQPFVPGWLKEGITMSLKRRERPPRGEDEDGVD